MPCIFWYSFWKKTQILPLKHCNFARRLFLMTFGITSPSMTSKSSSLAFERHLLLTCSLITNWWDNLTGEAGWNMGCEIDGTSTFVGWRIISDICCNEPCSLGASLTYRLQHENTHGAMSDIWTFLQYQRAHQHFKTIIFVCFFHGCLGMFNWLQSQRIFRGISIQL